MYKQLKLALAGLIIATAIPSSAAAFCGFYVGGAGAELFNDATQVVLLRDGTKTVLSMQNRYSGPPEDFAMVIPVPVILGEDDVKTLDSESFAKVDTLTSPRLVEYWERDPCERDDYYENDAFAGAQNNSVNNAGNNSNNQQPAPPVVVEAQFTVGEYNIKIPVSYTHLTLPTKA